MTDPAPPYPPVFQVSYGALLATFWEFVDPLQENGQGNDNGTQYRSGVYPHTPEQMAEALASVAAEQLKFKRPIMTEVKEAVVYWPAEEEHQGYLWQGGRFGSPQSNEKGCTDDIRCYG